MLWACPESRAERVEDGVVVEEVETGSLAEKVGLRPDDVIVSWARPAAPANPEPARGSITSPLDLIEVIVEQAPRGETILSGRRGDTAMSWTFPAPVSIDIVVRPVSFPAPLLALYREGRELVREKKVSEGAALWGVAAARAEEDGDRLTSVYLWSRSATVLARTTLRPQADRAFEHAVRGAEALGRPRKVSELLRHWGDSFRIRGDYHRAEELCRRALATDERVGVSRLAAARDWLDLGGNAWELGDLDAAEERWLKTLTIGEAEAPRSRITRAALFNLCMVHEYRGNLVLAETYGRRALALHEANTPESLGVGACLSNLGQIAARRGDMAAAEGYERRALAIREKLKPGSGQVALSLSALGDFAHARGDLADAARFYQRSLEILDAQESNDDVYAAEVVFHYGRLNTDLGNLKAAESQLQRALAVYEKLGVGGTSAADCFHALARLAERRGNAGDEERYLRQALAIHQKVTPGTAFEADALHALGQFQRRQGQLEAASRSFLEALDALERQQARLGGTQEARSGFRAKYSAYYHDGVQLLTRMGRVAEALHVLERSRARVFLALLAERDLVFSADISPDLVRERGVLNVEFDRAQAAMAETAEGAAREASTERLRALREKQEDLAARIRAASPRLASLQYPQPLDLAGIRAALDPGTVFLAYSVGKEETILFVVRDAITPGPGLSVFTLPVSEAALRHEVAAFRRVVQDPPGVATPGALAEQAAALFDLLIQPAEAEIAGSQRLLVSPDGPLHSLPFAALVRKPGRGKEPGSYLVEWKPLHVVPSATVYAQLKQARRESAGSSALVAFGNPRYPRLSTKDADRIASPEVRDAVSRGASFVPLAATRAEVERITRVFAGRARSYLGEAATEERAKALGKDTRYVHFACHGSLDERFPLNSGLALSIPEHPAEGQDNGLLQAWEIFESVRLNADLVTLSACRTALGKEMGGEGLLGLTRAFHYAGARAVLATLWSVSDRSTTQLMARFYARLKAGDSLDQALRAAQLGMIRSGAGLAHPFRWAAFQLSGDWK